MMIAALAAFSVAYGATGPLVAEGFGGPGLPGWADPSAAAEWTFAPGRGREGTGALAARTGAGSFLTRAVGREVGGVLSLSLATRTQRDSSRRGLSFGLSTGGPQPIAHRLLEVCFQAGGRVAYYDGTAWVPLWAYPPDQWLQVSVVADLDAGVMSCSVDGQPVGPASVPLLNGYTTVDALFLGNQGSGGAEQEVMVDELELTESPVPPAPRQAFAQVTKRGAELSWEPPPEAPAAYRILRDGRPYAELPAPARGFIDANAGGESRRYNIIAAYGDGRTSLPTRDSWALVLPPRPQGQTEAGEFDVVVVGGTPGGIGAAVAAAREGSSVALVVAAEHLGGMMSGGLGRTDFGRSSAVGGIAREFIEDVARFYLDIYGEDSPQVRASAGGFYFEPGVSEAMFNRLVADLPAIHVYFGHRLVDVVKTGSRIGAVHVQGPAAPKPIELDADAFVDATYEGDLLAQAGAPYVVGREGRGEFGEEYAGRIYWDLTTHELLPGSSGEGDSRVQAYNYRLCLTNNPANRVPIPEPASYDPARYALLAQCIREKPVPAVNLVVDFGPLPNSKFDINNHPFSWMSSDDVEQNADYPEADPETRERIAAEHRDYILGLLYFIQHDPSVPKGIRDEAGQYGLARDEFPDNGHFPYQLYVREARRMRGAYVFTEHDARPAPASTRPSLHRDSIATGAYAMDSHATRKWDPQWPNAHEGFFYLGGGTQPYQIPYRVLLPGNVDNLLVCVCVSATHIGYGTLRMEPVYMAMGEAAGMAAHFVAGLRVRASNVPIGLLQDKLLARGQLVSVFDDVLARDLNERAVQLVGTRYTFPSLQAEPSGPTTRAEAARWSLLLLQDVAPGRAAELSPADPRFEDVSQVHPGYDAVEALVQLGLLPPGGRFRGDQPVSRSDAFRWLVAAADRELPPLVDDSGERFRDIGREHPAFAAAGRLFDAGIITGTPSSPTEALGHYLRPDATITRGDLCRVVYGLLRYGKLVSPVHAELWPR